MLLKELTKTVLLVHGAWHGSWCWHKVVHNLQQKGHAVAAIDLPGHHQNHRPFADVILASYVQSIEEAVLSSRRPVTLVGHSMAGVAISQVAENIPHKIERLVYVCAFIPQNGGSLASEEQLFSDKRVSSAAVINEPASAISLNSSEPLRDIFYNKCNDEDREYALARLQNQPIRPFADTITISSERFGTVPKRYIECLQDNAIIVEEQRRMYSKVDCDVKTIDTDHSPFFSAAQQLSEFIVQEG